MVMGTGNDSSLAVRFVVVAKSGAVAKGGLRNSATAVQASWLLHTPTKFLGRSDAKIQ